MKLLSYTDINHLVYLYIQGDDSDIPSKLNTISKMVAGTDLVIDFTEFLKSQLNYKLIDTSYVDLILTSVYSITGNQKEEFLYDINFRQAILKLFHKFIDIMIPVAIYIYDKYDITVSFRVAQPYADIDVALAILNYNDLSLIPSVTNEIAFKEFIFSQNDSFSSINMTLEDEYVQRLFSQYKFIKERGMV